MRFGVLGLADVGPRVGGGGELRQVAPVGAAAGSSCASSPPTSRSTACSPHGDEGTKFYVNIGFGI